MWKLIKPNKKLQKFGISFVVYSIQTALGAVIIITKERSEWFNQDISVVGKNENGILPMGMIFVVVLPFIL